MQEQLENTVKTQASINNFAILSNKHRSHATLQIIPIELIASCLYFLSHFQLLFNHLTEVFLKSEKIQCSWTMESIGKRWKVGSSKKLFLQHDAITIFMEASNTLSHFFQPALDSAFSLGLKFRKFEFYDHLFSLLDPDAQSPHFFSLLTPFRDIIL